MTNLFEGKEAVLKHLEEEARKRTGGKDGVYALRVDDAGTLVAIIAGHIFVGTGTTTWGGQKMTLVNGVLVHADPPLKP